MTTVLPRRKRAAEQAAPEPAASEEAARLTAAIGQLNTRRAGLSARLDEMASERADAVSLGVEPPDNTAERREIRDSLEDINNDIEVLEVALAVHQETLDRQRKVAEYEAAVEAYDADLEKLSPLAATVLSTVDDQIQATLAAARAAAQSGIDLVLAQDQARSSHQTAALAAAALDLPAPTPPPDTVNETSLAWYHEHRTGMVGAVLDSKGGLRPVLEGLMHEASFRVTI